MALTALDRPNLKGQPAGLYWGGWELLARAINVSSHSPTKTQQEMVRRVTKALTEGGLIRPQVEHARTNTRQVWQLLLDEREPLANSGAQPLANSGAPAPRDARETAPLGERGLGGTSKRGED